ncbi:hypothetical protein [Knoellia subterranea]|uniref:DUF4439 domain-containing protein n=1 Tax=Knoellia subterranea KCTC 19937 TaxID=1385521 RepID=A0A0A0JI99_9MICO|nr:hypothetical protein [Knoellia subterranea]KGN36848.1 hypothetical protein N803_17580 [Knoellia subterranea KCTC 19937]
MRDVSPGGSTPSRRLVVAGGLGLIGTAVVSLSGCGIRLEDDAPRVPLLPTRTPLAGEDAMLALLAAVRSAADSAVSPPSSLAGLVQPLHEQQATVLHDALRSRGVPEADLTPSPTATATGTPTTTPTGTPVATPSPSGSNSAPSTTLDALESVVIEAGAGLDDAEEELRPMLLGILAQAHAGLDLAGHPAPPPTDESSSDSAGSAWTDVTPVATLITAIRRATYFTQIAAARSTKDQRAAMLRDLAALATVTRELVGTAGDRAPEPELGLPLPHAVTTDEEARRLAAESAGDLLAAWGGELATLADGSPEAAFSDVPRWLGTVAAVAHRRGVALTAFPGLK